MSHMSFNSIRFGRAPSQVGNGRDPLSDDQIRALAPSVFATEAHESRSERFAYIPTFQVVTAMRNEGFIPVRAVQGRSRVPGKAEFTKHMLRFRHAGQVGQARKVGDIIPEVALINAHDGTSAYRLMAGLFRLVCLNGMVVMEREGTDVHVPHKGDVAGQVIEGSYRVISEFVRAIDDAEAWTGTTLNRDEQMALATAAHTLRFGDAEGNVETPIQPEQLLIARRHDDAGSNLWLTHNRLQENIIRGGLTARGRDANGRPRRTTTREVRNIDGDVKLNRALWVLSDAMAKLKQAA